MSNILKIQMPYFCLSTFEFDLLLIFLIQICCDVFHPLSFIDTENSFYFSWIPPNSILSESSMRYCFWFGMSKRDSHFKSNFRMLIFKQNYLLIFSRFRLSHAISFYGHLKQFCWRFLCFPKKLPILEDQSAQHHRCLNYHVIPVNNTWFPWYNVHIMLIKSLLGFNNIFPHRIIVFNQHIIFL